MPRPELTPSMWGASEYDRGVLYACTGPGCDYAVTCNFEGQYRVEPCRDHPLDDMVTSDPSVAPGDRRILNSGVGR